MKLDVFSYLALIFFSQSGTGFSVRNHSPLKALTSQFVSSANPVVSIAVFLSHDANSRLTIINNFVGIMEVNAMIAIRKDVHVIIFHAGEIEFIEECVCGLGVYIVICDTVHNEEAHILCEGGYVVD
jgi:hypothetical protein